MRAGPSARRRSISSRSGLEHVGSNRSLTLCEKKRSQFAESVARGVLTASSRPPNVPHAPSTERWRLMALRVAVASAAVSRKAGRKRHRLGALLCGTGARRGSGRTSSRCGAIATLSGTRGHVRSGRVRGLTLDMSAVERLARNCCEAAPGLGTTFRKLRAFPPDGCLTGSAPRLVSCLHRARSVEVDGSPSGHRLAEVSRRRRTRRHRLGASLRREDSPSGHGPKAPCISWPRAPARRSSPAPSSSSTRCSSPRSRRSSRTTRTSSASRSRAPACCSARSAPARSSAACPAGSPPHASGRSTRSSGDSCSSASRASPSRSPTRR